MTRIRYYTDHFENVALALKFIDILMMLDFKFEKLTKQQFLRISSLIKLVICVRNFYVLKTMITGFNRVLTRKNKPLFENVKHPSSFI